MGIHGFESLEVDVVVLFWREEAGSSFGVVGVRITVVVGECLEGYAEVTEEAFGVVCRAPGGVGRLVLASEEDVVGFEVLGVVVLARRPEAEGA